MRCPFAVWDPSPNYSVGWHQSPQGAMQHSTASFWNSALTTLKRPNGVYSVSSHFLIRNSDGEIRQLVDTSNRSWAQRNCNETHFSIEHDDENDPYNLVRSDALYESSGRLNGWLATEHGYTPSPETLPPHRSCVNTACPAGLDLDRVLAETLGVDVLSREEFNTWLADFKGTTIAYIADRLAKDAHHLHGEPVEGLAIARRRQLIKKLEKELGSTLPTLRPLKKIRGTKAHARQGHGPTAKQFAERER